MHMSVVGRVMHLSQFLEKQALNTLLAGNFNNFVELIIL